MPLPKPYIRRSDPVVPLKPWITGTMLLVMVYLFYQATAQGPNWLRLQSFSPAGLEFCLGHRQYFSLISMVFRATFCSLSAWHFLGNAYFLWVFGSLVELRLGHRYFFTLILLSIFVPWFFQVCVAGASNQSLYIGPGLLIASVIGAYMLFFPEPKINPGGTIGRTAKLFKDEPTPDPAAAFGIAPWWIIAAFVLFQTAMHFMQAARPPYFQTIHLVSGSGAFVFGLVVCSVLVAFAGRGITGNPLKMLAVKRYRQLRSLDIGHDEAIIGTAKLLSCPVEQVKEWIARGLSGLPD